MKIRSLEDLFVDQLQDIYDAEEQIIEALPEMASAASSKELKQAFKEHLNVTRKQKERLDKIFKQLGKQPKKSKTCHGMQGLVKEGRELLKEDVESNVLDAGLIAAAQKVEHYEIASYGTVRTYARELGFDDAADLLQETLEEESETDEKLTRLAESSINLQANR
jgi:ferritin-like metal-binding protein YciE